MRHAHIGGCALLGSAAALLACGAPESAPSALDSRSAALLGGEARWQRQAVPLPPARMAHALIYDSVRQQTLAVGGRPPPE